MGKFDPAKHLSFVKIVPPYADNNERYLRKDTYKAFKKMYDAAQKDGIKLTIISATRNFESQKGIWEAKWTGARLVDDEDISKTIPDPRQRALKILEYSSMPGSSRHHWGTDVDLNNLSDSHFQTGEGKKVYDWLRANAHQYGFCQPYSLKGEDRPAGYNEEKWHWSYMPIAKKLTKLAKEKLKDDMIQGFKGAETAKTIGIVEKYVLGINKECLYVE
jgi:LAS superfamily LD-carboxypeptidase LdcB